MVAQRELRGFRRKHPIVVTVEHPSQIPCSSTANLFRSNLSRGLRPSSPPGRSLGRVPSGQQSPHCGVCTRINNFRRAQAFEFGHQRRFIFQLGRVEIAGGEIDQRKTEHLAALIDSREIIVPLGAEQSLVEMRAGAEDLRDGALDELAGPRVLHLVADGDLAPGLEQSRDVASGGVVGNAAHRHDAAFGERNIEQWRAGFRIFEKEFVKIPEAEEQQRVFGQFAFDASILRHHRSELSVTAHRAKR